MKANLFKWWLALSALLAMPGTGIAQKLKVGDPAPALKVGKWIKGEPVAKLEEGRIHVLEFWATWCGPCVQAIPHVSKLQKEYPDLVFIGVNVWENEPEKVARFVAKMGDKMAYRVVLDDVAEGKEEGTMARTWLEAAGQDGIPTSMVVGKDGKLQWVGHPDDLDRVLQAVAKGEPVPADAEEAGEEEDGGDVPMTPEEEKLDKIYSLISEALEGVEEAGRALEILEKLEKDSPETRGVAMGTRISILLEEERHAEAIKLASRFLEVEKEAADMLNETAWAMVMTPDIGMEGLAVALQLAEQAVKASQEKEPDMLDTLARIHFEIGRAKAIIIQNRALEVAEADQGGMAEAQREIIRRALNAYQNFDVEEGGAMVPDDGEGGMEEEEMEDPEEK